MIDLVKYGWIKRDISDSIYKTKFHTISILMTTFGSKDENFQYVLIDQYFIQHIHKWLPLINDKSVSGSYLALKKSVLFTQFITYLKSNPKIVWNEQQYQRSKNAIEKQLFGRFLKAKFDNLGHYYPSLLDDKVILKALESMNKSDF